MKIPKSLATVADMLYQKRLERLEAQRVVELLAEQEAALREFLIDNLPKSDATGISGKLATARIELKEVVQVEDFNKLYEYIVKNHKAGAFALLQRRVGDAAVKELWAAGKKVPGVTQIKVPVVSLTKR